MALGDLRGGIAKLGIAVVIEWRGQFRPDDERRGQSLR